MAKSIKRNLFYNTLLNVSAVIFPLITAPYVARVLQPDNIGLFNFANTYAGYFALVAALGIPTYGVRELAKLRDDKIALEKLLSELFSINVYTTVIVSIIYIASLFIIGQMRMNVLFFLIAGFVIYTSPFSIEWFYQGLEDFGFITLRTLVVRVISIVGLFIFVRDSADVTNYLLLNVFGSVVGKIWNYTVLVHSGMRLHLVHKGLRKHMKPVLTLFTSSIAISIYTVLDTIMLGFITNYSQVAYYNQATHISRTFLSIITSLSIVAMPRVSYYMKNKEWLEINTLMQKSFGIISLMAIPVALGLFIISPIFVPWFFSKTFMGTIVPLQIMSFSIIVIGFNNLLGVQILLGLGKDRLFLYSVLVGTISNFLMNCFMIPLWGATGASIASVTAETLVLLLEIYFVYTKTRIRISASGDIIKSLFGSLLFFPISYLVLQHLDSWRYLLVFIPVGILVYFGFEFIVRNQSLMLFSNIIINKIRRK
ncbi:MAG: flippase [Prevotella sp.]|jgi:O-antigen/teichoic acid export membrane protein|nr:flippase [Prevotella sp.]